eukprot:scaffold57154_cov16-Tisochrysis_lutea.AAC.2
MVLPLRQAGLLSALFGLEMAGSLWIKITDRWGRLVDQDHRQVRSECVLVKRVQAFVEMQAGEVKHVPVRFIIMKQGKAHAGDVEHKRMRSGTQQSAEESAGRQY